MNEWMNEWLTKPQHENYIAYWMLNNGIYMKCTIENDTLNIQNSYTTQYKELSKIKTSHLS